jgi:two-component system OmpR family sensor kinase
VGGVRKTGLGVGMRSLKGRFALLVGSAALLVTLAAGGLFWALYAVEGTMERALAAQARLELLAELSGRLGDYGLATVDAANAATPSSSRLAVPRAEVERVLRNVDAKLGDTVASLDTLLDRTEFAARSRPLASLRAGLNVLDRQVEQALRQPDPVLRGDAIRGALNAFAAATGPTLSFLVEAEKRSIDRASEDARRLTADLRLAALLAAAAGLVAVVLMHRSITRPLFARLASVRSAAAAIGRGELDTRIPVRTRDELGLLVANFNRMAARLARRERQVARDRAALEDVIRQRTADLVAANARLAEVDQARKRFFADVSHELRTPLTVILGECDIGLRTLPGEPEGFRSVLSTIRKRAQRLHRRVEDLLRLARSDSGQLALTLQRVSLSAILADAVESCAAAARRRKIALEFSPGSADVEVLADPEWLRQIVEGLIDNALRHAAGATRIVVALLATPAGAEIAVSDDGPGFGAEGDELLERFARSPGRAGTSGFGIGLALARWVVERHDGEIRLERSETGRGARIVIRLPAERREDAA